MTRLLDELEPGFERSLLEAAREDGPSRDARRRTLACGLAAATRVTGVTGLGARGRSGLLSRGSSTVAWKMIGVAAVTAGVAAGAMHGLAPNPRLRASPPGKVRPSVVIAPPMVTLPSPATGEAHTAPPALAAVPPAPRPMQAPLLAKAVAEASPIRGERHDEARGEPPPEHAEPTDTLDDEIALIDAARIALAQGKSDRAREILETYAARHSRGTLAMEASLLRLESLVHAGERAEAERLARAIDPTTSGPYAARIRALLSEASAPR